MLNQEEIKRYARHLILPELGEEGQLKLKNAKVLVVGAGGLGCPVLQYLAAAGMGTIGIVDPDRVDASNLQRQVLFSTADVGRLKVEVAAEKLKALNPFCSMITHPVYLSALNALGIISTYDLVIDGSDNFATRYLVNDACVILGKPLVFGSIFKFEGQVSVFNYEGGPTYRCLYPEPPSAGEVPNCAETGVLGVLPGICGTLMANEALKVILALKEVLSGKLLVFHALNMQFNVVEFDALEQNKNIQALTNYEAFCGSTPEISAEEFRRKIGLKHNFQLVDVREEMEYKQRNIGGLLIPLGTLADNLSKLDPAREIIVHCASGARSKKAVGLLRENGFKQVFSLRNGLLDL